MSLYNDLTAVLTKIKQNEFNIKLALSLECGVAPTVVSNISDMTDTNQIYVLSTDGYWYYHDGSTWISGGEYGAVVTDVTLTQSGTPADAKVVGDAIRTLAKNIVVNEDVAGLYDIVAQQFLHSDSGTELVAGAEIETDTDSDAPITESNVLLVTVAMTNNTFGVADKTYTEVIEAWNAGKVIRGYAPALNGEIDFTTHLGIDTEEEWFIGVLPQIVGATVGTTLIVMMKGQTDDDNMSIVIQS